MNKKSIVKFQVGDRVRVSSYKYTFNNKYDSNWTREIFAITEILKTRPVTNKIKDLNGEEIVGTFYNEELQKTAFWTQTDSILQSCYLFVII